MGGWHYVFPLYRFVSLWWPWCDKKWSSKNTVSYLKDRKRGQPADYEYYLATLAEFKVVYDDKVFGFCLMTNHVHFIFQPSEKVEGVGNLMKRLAGRQTRHVN